jgi:penicillin-binding protein 1A
MVPDDREQVLDPGTAFQMVHILEGVIQRGTAAFEVGSKLKMPLAGKTGTTNGPNDTWFVGFSPDLVVGIYVGFDQPKELGPGEQGTRTAAPAFTEFMADALRDKPAAGFRIPPGIRMARVELGSGKLAEPGDTKAIWEAFKPGTEPSDEVVDGGEDAQAVPADAPSAAPLEYGVGQLVPPAPAAGPAPGTIVNQRPAPPPATGTTGLY